MSRVLVRTFVGDAHGLAVVAHLRCMGVEAELWYSDLFPAHQEYMFRASDNELRIVSKDRGGLIDLACYDVVWWRRPLKGFRHDESVHPADSTYVTTQASVFYRMMESLFGNAVDVWPHLTWVNPPDKARQAESKLLQLAWARACGFEVIPTLVSNSPSEIRSFISQQDGAVCKSLYPFFWAEAGGRANLTASVGIDDAESDVSLSASPEIFQKRIDKAKEYRILIAGPYSFAVEIAPPSEVRGEVDWRMFHLSRRSTNPLHEVPDYLLGPCREMMKKAGLVTASFDLLKDHAGQVFFSDLNQAGQFLWMEEIGLPVLDAFCNFLISPRAPAHRTLANHTLEDVHQSSEFLRLQCAEAQLPVPPSG